MTIVINPQNDSRQYFKPEFKDNTHLFSFIYLHGELQDRLGCDLCGVVGLNPNSIKEGIHPCEVYFVEEPCTLFTWKSKFNRQHGLIVLDSDAEQYEYAKKCYETKTASL